VGVLILAVASTQIYLRLFGREGVDKEVAESGFVEDLGGPALLAIWLGMAAIVFLIINIFFYTSFFTNYPQGIFDALSTFKIWTKTGTLAHVHPPSTYLLWLIQQESALLSLGVIGAVLILFRPKNVFALFSAFWAFGLIAAYSLVPYKTPWLVLNFLLPLALISGYAVQRFYELERGQLRLPLVIIVVASLIGLYQMVDLNFVNYDNDNTYYVYAYAHTKRGTNRLVEEIDRIANQQGQGGKTGITIVSREYWPLPWYLRNYSRVGYFGHMTTSTEPIIIASEDQRAEMQANFGSAYHEVPSNESGGAYSLRPGVNLLLYVKSPESNP